MAPLHLMGILTDLYTNIRPFKSSLLYSCATKERILGRPYQGVKPVLLLVNNFLQKRLSLSFQAHSEHSPTRQKPSPAAWLPSSKYLQASRCHDADVPGTSPAPTLQWS